ncbi:MAG: hypothetical protein HYT40_04020 [Candidatus Sungbacteria bacterium]|uniref:Uncharacterized protein n=1 Tax=Candidatus Sungiibacteriota bacterium TaxID=2750080 RepID=A0A931SCA7_9BACT|nr:hypothetical protein [Candidatus Sungbacteria bacterium]
MGYWIIQIEGYGPHHNRDYPKDADKMAEVFGGTLKQLGHNVQAVRFYSASPPERLDPDRPTAAEPVAPEADPEGSPV